MIAEWASIYIIYDASITLFEKAWTWHEVPVPNHLMEIESEFAPWDLSKAHILVSTPATLCNWLCTNGFTIKPPVTDSLLLIGDKEESMLTKNTRNSKQIASVSFLQDLHLIRVCTRTNFFGQKIYALSMVSELSSHMELFFDQFSKNCQMWRQWSVIALVGQVLGTFRVSCLNTKKLVAPMCENRFLFQRQWSLCLHASHVQHVPRHAGWFGGEHHVSAENGEFPLFWQMWDLGFPESIPRIYVQSCWRCDGATLHCLDIWFSDLWRCAPNCLDSCAYTQKQGAARLWNPL